MILGNGGTNWGMADASPPDADGWQRDRGRPDVVAARVAGLSHGFLVFDDTGSEWTREGERFTSGSSPTGSSTAATRTGRSAPYLTVEPGRRRTGSRRPRRADLTCRVARPAPRRGDRLVGHARATRGRPARSGFIADARRPARAPRADPAGRPARRARSRCTCATWAWSAVPSARGPVRAVDGAGNVGPAGDGDGPASRASRPSRCRAEPPELPRMARARRPCRAWARARWP